MEKPQRGKKKKRPKKRRKRHKTRKLPIHETAKVRPEELPEGSRFKGYEDFTVQDIRIELHNTRFRLERWETPSGERLVGKLPAELNGRHFGPTLIAYILHQYHHAHVTQPLLLEQLREWGIDISAGQISAIITEVKEDFHAEKEERLHVGLHESDYINVDDTGSRHQGKNGYLGYQPLPGAQMRYFVRAQGRIVALLGFGAAAWKTRPRDRFIGWTAEQRKARLHLVVNNARFLIPPWVRCNNLASCVLAMVVRRIAQDWQQQYGYSPILLETFVEASRFRGTCYSAANWSLLGETTGRGKLDVHHRASVPKKTVWVYPLLADFREVLCNG